MIILAVTEEKAKLFLLCCFRIYKERTEKVRNGEKPQALPFIVVSWSSDLRSLS